MRYVLLALSGSLFACGGVVSKPEATNGRGDYQRSETSPIYLTSPGGANDLTVACDLEADAVVTGGCEVGQHGQVVADMAMPHGWMCGATTSVDGVSLTAWVECSPR